MLKTETIYRIFIVTLLLIVATILTTTPIFSASAEHLVISEIQVSGNEDSDEDFIELYNPTNSDVDLADMRLVKRTSSGDSDSNIVSFTDGDIIPAHGYFLWCNTLLSTELACDKSTSATISNNNSIGLREEPADTGELIDSVTFGEVTNTLGEGTSLTAPEDDTSVERKALSTSTAESMAIGGEDEFNGNSEDTNDNSIDFVTKALPQPQNTSSDLENFEDVSPTPSPTNTPEPTETPTPTPSVEPTNTPTPTPSETPEPTISPTQTPTPTPEPTSSPEPSATPQPSTTPLPSPSGTPTPVVIHSFTWPGFRLICTMQFIPYHTSWFSYYIPMVSCLQTPLI